MLASLGRGFRKQARTGQVSAFVVSVNKDGSLKLTQARVVTTGMVEHTVIHLSVSWTIGFLGLISTLRGAKGSAHAVHVHQSHVGSDDQATHAILARAGENAAVALVCCKDAETHHTVAERASDLGSESWDGTRTDFVGSLDPGSKHDWVRTALGEPPTPRRTSGRRLESGHETDSWADLHAARRQGLPSHDVSA